MTVWSPFLEKDVQKTYWHQTRQGCNYGRRLPPYKVAWAFDLRTNLRSRWILKKLSPAWQDLWPRNLAGCWLQVGGSQHKYILILQSNFSFFVCSWNRNLNFASVEAFLQIIYIRELANSPYIVFAYIPKFQFL